jgi:hypothetical protein
MRLRSCSCHSRMALCAPSPVRPRTLPSFRGGTALSVTGAFGSLVPPVLRFPGVFLAFTSFPVEYADHNPVWMGLSVGARRRDVGRFRN